MIVKNLVQHLHCNWNNSAKTEGLILVHSRREEEQRNKQGRYIDREVFCKHFHLRITPSIPLKNPNTPSGDQTLATLLSSTPWHVQEFSNMKNKYDTDGNHYRPEKYWCGYFSGKHSPSESC